MEYAFEGMFGVLCVVITFLEDVHFAGEIFYARERILTLLKVGLVPLEFFTRG
jgi:hypothetical protein